MLQGSPRFDTTLWGEVMLAAREPDSASGKKALSRLCEGYWYPIYAFIRRKGVSPHDASDLTQGFFEHILTNGFFGRADPERGRFRNFLLGALGHYMSNERERRSSQKRGGKVERVSIDETLGEQWLASEPSADNDATKAFDRSWADTVFKHALKILEEEQMSSGKGDAFKVLKQFLQRPAVPGEYLEIATRLGTNKGAVAVAVHRLNDRFALILRKAVTDTVATPDMAEEELRFLVASLGN